MPWSLSQNIVIELLGSVVLTALLQTLSLIEKRADRIRHHHPTTALFWHIDEVLVSECDLSFGEIANGGKTAKAFQQG